MERRYFLSMSLLAALTQPVQPLRAKDGACLLHSKAAAQSVVGGDKYGENTAFNKWYAQAVRKAEAQLRAGASMEKVLADLVTSRHAFAHENDAKNAVENRVGVLRGDESTYYPGVLGSIRPVEFADETNSPERIALMTALAQKIRARGEPALTDEQGQVWNNSYTLRDGTKVAVGDTAINNWPIRTADGDIPASTIAYEAATGANAKIIMADVHQRLEKIRQDGPSLKSEEDFLRAMYGFFTAMPFYKGSASIGRVYFESIGRTVFGKGAFDPDIDGYALTLGEDAFIAHFRKEIFDR